jgi:predicted transcriptional regulator
MAKAKRAAMVGTMVPDELKEELQRIADADSRSLSFVVNAALRSTEKTNNSARKMTHDSR